MRTVSIPEQSTLLELPKSRLDGTRIGVVAETAEGETRVAATPSTVAQLIKLGYDVSVQAGAGGAS
ncbi:hypothetical protein, partial [Subtercola lobariae]|uniref:hypothetical protein n=1 Tax=Subtercola lobariae TaxID=1588641 RepID=UPI0019411F1D